MDEDRLSAALRDATDDVEVPRGLVRRAERAGRARRARRRSAATALAVGVVVLAGGALVVPQIRSGGADTASSTAGGGSSDSSAADASAPPLADAAPEAAQGSTPDARAEPGPADAQGDACDPALVVDGVRVREGDAAPVVAGAAVEIAAAPFCGPAPAGAGYTVVLVPQGSQAPTALGDVAPTADGSFATTVTLPASTPPGPARLSVTASAAASACLDAGCTGADSSAEVDVLPAAP